LRARAQIGAVDLLDFSRLREIELVEAAVERHAALEQQRSHRSIGEERRAGQAFEKRSRHERATVRTRSRGFKTRTHASAVFSWLACADAAVMDFARPAPKRRREPQ